tara:strand:- start:1623 stop:1877 length:255 start_codon:yes stop_codon:yes gene_type:complete
METNMAKGKSGRHVTGRSITTPTWFGSHASMVVDHSEIQIGGKDVRLSEDQVLCKDDNGYYVTEKKKLDSGLADPNRYSNRRFK